ncbi:MAG: cell division protein FtsA [Capsulimonadaceae bacterium]
MARDCIVGLDIGTTKVCTVVVEVEDRGRLNVVGIGNSLSRGIRKGVVVDIDSATSAVIESVDKARAMSGYDIHRVIVGVTGEHIASLNARGVIAVTHASREITADDVERVNDQSRVIVLPPDREIIHAIPRSYSIDGQSGIRFPVGMSGTRLEVDTHIVTGAITFIQNVAKCVQKAGLTIEATVLEPIATAEAVALNDEKNLGVCIADIGGGTTDVAIFVDGDIFYSSAIGVGGNHVTRDISVGLRASHEEAERIKVHHAVAMVSQADPEGKFEVTSLGSDEPRELPSRILAEIVEARMLELFTMLKQEIMKSNHYNLLPAGVILSGGGSQLTGAAELCKQVTGMPSRVGRVREVGGVSDTLRSPVYATAVGLVQYGAKYHHKHRMDAQEGALSGRMMRAIAQWLRRVAGLDH